MDSLTQAVLGAAIGELVLGKKMGNKAALAGAIVGTIPDLDVALYLFYSPFEMLSIHRGLSHSIAFTLLGALLIAFILSKLRWFRGVPYNVLVLFVWLGLFTHVLLDTFTAYGTQLLLPFSNQRLGFDSINVVDPVYTIPLIVGLAMSLWRETSHSSRSWYCGLGLIISSCYLILTLVNKQGVEASIKERMYEEGIEFSSIMTMPVGVANVNWYGVTKSSDSIYLLKHSVFSNSNPPIEAFPINDAYLDEVDVDMANKMRWFAKGFYTVEKVNGNIRVYNLQVDMRGVVKNGNHKAPTVGYFEIANVRGASVFSSGSLAQ